MSPRTRASIVVVGDCLRDVDVFGAVERLCPDAPAPVLAADRRRERPGGAGLTALLAARSTARPVRLVTALGSDGDEMRGLLAGVDVVAVTTGGTTPTKTRMLADDRVLLRVDEGGLDPVAVDARSDVVDAIAGAGVVLVSDYGRGLTADPVVRAALEDAAARVPLVWDPHPNGAPPVPGATLVTPNLSEARTYVSGIPGYGRGIRSHGFPGEPAALGEALREHWGVDAVAVTAGREGAVLRGATGTSVTPARPARGGDPCGAGDRFAASVAVALADGSAVDEAVRVAVSAAASFVAAGGAAALADDETRAPEPGPDVVAAARARGGTVVATGGCFDLLHAGHARTLAAARALAGEDGVLVVCLNSDASVRRLKGPDRPVVNEADRAEMLTALAVVDAVEVFDEDDPRAVLDRLRPDVWVKGGDYATDELLETPLVRSWGGEVVAVPYHAGRSSTRLLARLDPPARTDSVPSGGTP